MSERIGAGVIEPRLLGRPYSYPIPARGQPHLGHGKHLCHLVEDVGISVDEYKKLISDAKYLCRNCGRVAAKADNLCEPIKL